MRKLIIDGPEMREPAETKGQSKEQPKAKAVKPSNKSRAVKTK